MIYANVEGNEDHKKSERLLVSDLSGLNFSFHKYTPQETSKSMRAEQLDNSKETLLSESKIIEA